MSADRSMKAVHGNLAKPDGKNSTRDMHRVFGDLGYFLPIPIQTMEHHTQVPDHQALTTYHVNPEDWVLHWMADCPSLLCGWDGGPAENFSAFWHCYHQSHPGHEVFSKHQGRLHKVVPLVIHGDEGRGVKRTNFMVVSMESPIGSLDDPTATTSCSCKSDLEKRSCIPSSGADANTLSQEVLRVAKKQMTNYKGHSYLSHWLLFGVGGWLYKKHPHIIDELMKKLATNFHRLFHEGVTLPDGSQYFGAVIGIKGDMDFHKKAMRLTRSYSNLGNDIEICHHCKAGGPHYGFEDYSENPAWEESLYQERPWPLEDPPPFSLVPYDRQCPERILQGDIFHIVKLGVARDIIGGCLILLLRLGFMDYPGSTTNIDDRFQRSHSYFAMWCRAQGKSPGLRKFSKAFFNMKSLVSAPWANCKGSDSVLLLQWLSFTLKLYIQNPPVQGHTVLLKNMLQVVDECLALRMLHTHRLWLPRKCAVIFYVRAMTVLRGYAVLGRAAVGLHIRAFIQKPKHHGLHHLAFQLKQDLLRGSTLLLSPQSMACEMNEDFLGRISRLSRRVGFRLCNLRVIERYFLKITCLLKVRRNVKVWKGKRVKKKS